MLVCFVIAAADLLFTDKINVSHMDMCVFCNLLLRASETLKCDI